MGKFKQLETDYPIPELLQRDIDALQKAWKMMFCMWTVCRTKSAVRRMAAQMPV